MPIYEYQCRACARRFELRQSFSDEPVRICPHCGVEDVRKLLSKPAGIFFKGPGFYSTDYKQGGQRVVRNGSSDEKETPTTESEPAPSTAATTTAAPLNDD